MICQACGLDKQKKKAPDWVPSFLLVRTMGRLPRFLRLCRRRLKNALLLGQQHFASKNGILLHRATVLHKLKSNSGGGASRPRRRREQKENAPDWGRFLFVGADDGT